MFYQEILWGHTFTCLLRKGSEIFKGTEASDSKRIMRSTLLLCLLVCLSRVNNNQ
jgi:hypothetical protein